MSIDFIYIKTNLVGMWIYNISFIFLFDSIFLKTFAQDSQTVGMFIIISVILQLYTAFLFILTTLGLLLIPIRQNVIINSIVLFILSEISVLLMTGDISLFGIFDTYNTSLSPNLDKSLIAFHQGRDFALSISGLLSCVVYFLFSWFRQRKQLPQSK